MVRRPTTVDDSVGLVCESGQYGDELGEVADRHTLAGVCDLDDAGDPSVARRRWYGAQDHGDRSRLARGSSGRSSRHCSRLAVTRPSNVHPDPHLDEAASAGAHAGRERV